MNRIKEGQAIAEKWTDGTIVCIYKNKGDPIECGNYRPICITQLIYKIWTGVVARKLTKIMRIMARNNQYGFKEGISTIDAIIKIDQYVERPNREAKILLMDLAKAFGTINRTLLLATLYKKGLPAVMIKHIRRGNRGKKLSPTYKGGDMESPERTISDYLKDQPSVRYYA